MKILRDSFFFFFSRETNTPQKLPLEAFPFSGTAPFSPSLSLLYYSKPVGFLTHWPIKEKSLSLSLLCCVCTVPIMVLDSCDERSDATNYVDLIRVVRCTVTHRIIKRYKRQKHENKKSCVRW